LKKLLTEFEAILQTKLSFIDHVSQGS